MTAKRIAVAPEAEKPPAERAIALQTELERLAGFDSDSEISTSVCDTDEDGEQFFVMLTEAAALRVVELMKARA